MKDDLTRSVRELYESHPYPERMPGGASDPYLELMRAYSDIAPSKRLSFLDAGCGTGLNSLGAAMLYPHCDVYACDFNRIALEQIEADRQSHELTNLEVREVDLHALPADFGPQKGFDVIFCTGVLHHLSEPEQALKTIVARLAPQGILRLMVYGAQGRSDLYRFARVAQQVWPEGAWSWSQRIDFAQDLMSDLQGYSQKTGLTPPPLRGTWSDACEVGAAEFADRYLHPQDRPYSGETLRALLESASLHFLDWFEPRDWDLKVLLPRFAAAADSPTDFWDRVSLIEELFERPKFDMYLVGPEFTRRLLDFSQHTSLSTNPQLFLESVTVRGNPLIQAGRLRTGAIEPLSRFQGKLLTALGRRFASLEELCAEWDEPLSDEHLEEARDLLELQFLYAPHPH